MSSVDMEMQIYHQMFPPLRFMLRKLQLYLINILEIWLLCCEKMQRKRSHYCNLPPDPGDLVQLISQSALFPFMLPRYTLCGLVHSHELKDSKYKVQPGVTLWSHPLPHPPSPRRRRPVRWSGEAQGRQLDSYCRQTGSSRLPWLLSASANDCYYDIPPARLFSPEQMNRRETGI